MRFVKPLDENLLDEIFLRFTKRSLPLKKGLLREALECLFWPIKIMVNMQEVEVECFGLPDPFIEHGIYVKII